MIIIIIIIINNSNNDNNIYIYMLTYANTLYIIDI